MMNVRRREFLAALLALLVLARGAAAAERPNILLILADDLAASTRPRGR
jgi:hypothetical protein